MSRRPFLGTIAFVLFGGPLLAVVAGPWLLTGFHIGRPLFGWEPVRWIGAALIILGSSLFLSLLPRFVRQGRGTPSPAAETEHLVVTGAYRFVRNPMYVAVLGILLGEGLLLGSAAVLVFAAAMAVAFALFVRLYEEPRLGQRFGDDYERFRREVPRWIPRLRPHRSQPSPSGGRR